MVQSNTLYAPKTGLYLPGTSGNYASTPDHADLDITGDLCLITKISLDDINSSNTYFILTKYIAASPCWAFEINGSSKTLKFSYTQTGAWVDQSINATKVLSSLFSSNEEFYAAVTLDFASQFLTFWTSKDGIIYTQFGDTKALTKTGIIAATSAINVGSHSNGAAIYKGGIISVQVYDGIGDNSAPGLGTLVAEADFSYPWANNKYTDSTGKVWTINGSAWAWEYQDDPEDKYTPTPEIWGGDAYQLIDDQINNSSSALHVLNGGNARGY